MIIKICQVLKIANSATEAIIVIAFFYLG